MQTADDCDFLHLQITACATAMCQVNEKAKISTPHSSHIFQPILMKLETKKDIRDTTPHAKFDWCGITGRGSA